MHLRVLLFLVEVALGRYSSGLDCGLGISLMSLIMIVLLLLCRIILMFGLMAVWFLIILQEFPLLELGFFAHHAERTPGREGRFVGGVVLMVFVLILDHCLLSEVFVRFLGHFNLFRGLSCGVSFWPFRHLVLFTLVLTILVWFDMSVVCLVVVVVLEPSEFVDDGDLLLID